MMGKDSLVDGRDSKMECFIRSSTKNNTDSQTIKKQGNGKDNNHSFFQDHFELFIHLSIHQMTISLIFQKKGGDGYVTSLICPISCCLPLQTIKSSTYHPSFILLNYFPQRGPLYIDYTDIQPSQLDY